MVPTGKGNIFRGTIYFHRAFKKDGFRAIVVRSQDSNESAGFAKYCFLVFLSSGWLHSRLAASILWYDEFRNLAAKELFLSAVVTKILLLLLIQICLTLSTCHPQISVAGLCVCVCGFPSSGIMSLLPLPSSD